MSQRCDWEVVSIGPCSMNALSSCVCFWCFWCLVPVDASHIASVDAFESVSIRSERQTNG